MNFRIPDTSSAQRAASRVNQQRARLGVLQEQLATGKRINRPSDDPNGAEAVIRLRTTQREIEHYQRTALAASQKLTAADDSLSGYENLLARTRTLISQGLSDTSSQTAKNALAEELVSLRARILNSANSKYGDEYVFGGTLQTLPPFDPVTAAPNGATATPQYIQVEPGANAIAVGVTANTIFSDATSNIFTDIDSAVLALRGTGNQTTDRATLESMYARVSVYNDLVNAAHAKVGANMNATDGAKDNLTSNFLSIDARASEIEGADFAETALAYAQATNALDATLKIASQDRKSLFDYL
jgi:flagellar hook-associated protein 3 FlgL